MTVEVAPRPTSRVVAAVRGFESRVYPLLLEEGCTWNKTTNKAERIIEAELANLVADEGFSSWARSLSPQPPVGKASLLLLTETTDHQFALCLVLEGPNYSVRTHDHGGTWVSIALLSGTETTRIFRRVSGANDRLEARDSVQLKSGVTSSVRAGEFHELVVVSDGACAVHMYGKNPELLSERQVYEESKKRISRRKFEIRFQEDLKSYIRSPLLEPEADSSIPSPYKPERTIAESVAGSETLQDASRTNMHHEEPDETAERGLFASSSVFIASAFGFAMLGELLFQGSVVALVAVSVSRLPDGEGGVSVHSR